MLPFLLAVDFMNFTYATNPCAANVPVPVVMRRGNFSYFDPKMGAGFDIHVAAVHIEDFRDAAAGRSEHTQRVGLVDHQEGVVLLLQA